jgi:hypothetical protein
MSGRARFSEYKLRMTVQHALDATSSTWRKSGYCYTAVTPDRDVLG